VKILVIDDERPARRRLRRLLDEVGGATVVGEAACGREALAAIERESPDLLLLDIDMPGIDGLALAAHHPLPPVVFVTAHEEHAVRAFDLEAIDYLLKPVTLDRLRTALRRAATRIEPPRPPPAAAEFPRVISHERGQVRLFDARAIARFRAVDKYTAFVVDGVEHLTEEPLSALEERLGPHGFIRIHRGELIDLGAVEALWLDDDGHRIRLRDGQVARASRRLVAGLRQRLGLHDPARGRGS
jgi:DNA-binding LytR/AlgR family response regulator